MRALVLCCLPWSLLANPWPDAYGGRVYDDRHKRASHAQATR